MVSSMEAKTYCYVLMLIASRLIDIIASLEFCQFEVFNASCPTPGHVLLIDSAYYGRLAIGRCVTRDYGHVGCSVDVYHVIDEMCSGRVHCRFPIPDLRLIIGLHPCPNDLTVYLDVKYHCVAVLELSSLTCDEDVSIGDAGSPVYISSESLAPALVANDDGTSHLPGTMVGLSQACPVQFEVDQGQTINISLLTFSWGQSQHLTADRATCSLHATITDGLRVKTVPLCGPEGSRKRVHESLLARLGFYVSRWHSPMESIGSINHTAVSYAAVPANRVFLLEISAVGCPDQAPQDGQWLERTGDRLLVGCNATGHVVQLICINKRWTGASINCTSTPVIHHHDRNAMIIATQPLKQIGIGIAVISGTCIGTTCGLILLGVIMAKSRRYTDRSVTELASHQQVGHHALIPLNKKCLLVTPRDEHCVQLYQSATGSDDVSKTFYRITTDDVNNEPMVIRLNSYHESLPGESHKATGITEFSECVPHALIHHCTTGFPETVKFHPDVLPRGQLTVVTCK